MRTPLIALTLLLSAPLLSGAVWAPSAGLAVNYHGSIYEHEGTWSTIEPAAELSLLSIALSEKHILSLPAELGYIADSGISGRLRAAGAISGTLSLRYEYIASSLIGLAASLETSILWHIKQEAASWRFGAGAALNIYAAKALAVTFPFSASWSRGVMSFTIGAGIRVLLGGGI